MRLITWNINSVRVRWERLLAVLERHQPDVVCLQETKVSDDLFPLLELSAKGYHAAIFGQRTYNGVAILSKTEPLNIQRGLGDREEAAQSRLLAADIQGVRVISAYVPNGGSLNDDRFAYKLEWLSRLRAMLERDYRPEQPLVIAGDMNVARDEKDLAFPERWEQSVLYCREVREALAQVLSWGLHDVFRDKHPEGGIYSWWDYRQLAFPKRDGLRIDHVFATGPLAQRCSAAMIDREERKGKQPSDHAPVVVDFS